MKSVVSLSRSAMPWPHVTKVSHYTTKFHCTLCNRQFSTESAISQHVLSTSHQQRADNDEDDQLKDRSTSLKQRYDMVFQRIADAEGGLHNWTDDPHGRSSRRITCELCNKYLFTPYDVKQHAIGATHQRQLGIERKVADLFGRWLPTYEEEVETMWELLNDLEGTEENISEADDCWFHCNLCEQFMSGPIPVIDHVRGRKHQDNLVGSVEGSGDYDDADYGDEY